MKDILQDIVANKRLEVERHKQVVTLDAMLSMGEKCFERPTLSMRHSLASSESGIIAEFKRKSPSKGWLFPDANVEDVIPAYNQNGACASSILTDSDFFGGSLNDLNRARALADDLPLLRKDFIVDIYQLYQARVMGADAVLLIASVLTPEECETFAEAAHLLGLEVLLEVHTEEELGHLNPNIDMLGVNNRNLGTFHTDVKNSFVLAEKMQSISREKGVSPLLVSESGLSDMDTVRSLREAGFRGFLIGETFMKTGDPGKALSDFIKS
jgi:Indole-3-glycerol phosphate synthase